MTNLANDVSGPVTRDSQVAPVLELEGVQVHFRTSEGTVRAVDGVDLRVAAGETLGLVGESGCGKSTLGRAAIRLEQVTAGTVRLEGDDITRLRGDRLRRRRRRMQMVFQDPVGSLNPRQRVAEIIAEPMRELGVAGRGDATRRTNELLALVRLPTSFARRYPGELSGGQAQRVALARAVGVDPAFIVADEATSALDVSVRAQILNLLDELRRELDLSYLFISHDLATVQHVSDRVAVMYLGKLVEVAATGDVFARPQHPYTAALLSAVLPPRVGDEPRRERIVLRGETPSPISPPAGCRFHPRCPIGPASDPTRQVCVTTPPPLVEASPTRWVACHFPGELAAQ